MRENLLLLDQPARAAPMTPAPATAKMKSTPHVEVGDLHPHRARVGSASAAHAGS
jgi:hypothetical protein